MFGVSTNLEDLDQFYWSLSPSSKFTTKTAYHALLPPQVPTDFKWRQVWQLPVQHRVRTFVYLVAHDAILCNAVRLHRHLTNYAACSRCGNTETVLHLLRDCPYINTAWLTRISPAMASAFFAADLHQWLSMNIQRETEWCSFFGYVLWYTWKSRNSLVFKGEFEIGRAHV